MFNNMLTLHNFRDGKNWDTAPDLISNQWSHHTRWAIVGKSKTVNLSFKKECQSTYDISQNSEETDKPTEDDSSKDDEEDFIPGLPNPYAKSSGSNNTVLIAAVSSTQRSIYF